MKKSKIKKLIKKELKKQCNVDIAGAVRGAIKEMEDGADIRELAQDEFVSSVLDEKPAYIGNDVDERESMTIEEHKILRDRHKGSVFITSDVKEALAFLTSHEYECTYIVKEREEKD